MICFHENGKELITKACAGATKGIICTPFYSERGLGLLDSFFSTAEEVDFWTRFSPLDWRAGVADMSALNRRVKSVLERGKKFNILASDDLHAKIFTFSNKRVIIGSANLTWPALTSNIEIICELTEKEATDFLSILPKFKVRLKPVSSGDFTAYVEAVADVITKSSDVPIEEDEEMNAAIDIAEETLRKSLSRGAPKAPALPHLKIERFIDYCSEEKSIISREIVNRIKGKHNLQGHVKHCFHGAVRFFKEYPKFIAKIASTPKDSLYDFTNPEILTHWRDFLRKHADEIDEKENFSFHTLRVYIPENLGGICSGGGGGSGTLKRILPLVARMLQTSGEKDED